MKLRTVIRTKCIERLPRRYRFFIERYYNMYCHSRSNFKDNMSMLRRLCKPDKVAVDVGASYGNVTL